MVRSDTVMKQDAALRFRRAGLTYEEIAERVGYRGKSGAHSAVMAALKRHSAGAAAEVRALELARLDALLKGAWPGAIAGDSVKVNTVLRIMGRRAALLGLDDEQARKREMDTFIRAHVDSILDDLEELLPADLFDKVLQHFAAG